MALSALLAACEPETTPEREGWRIMLAVAQTLEPGADLDRLVDYAIELSPCMLDANRGFVEEVALRMLFTAKAGA